MRKKQEKCGTAVCSPLTKNNYVRVKREANKSWEIPLLKGSVSPLDLGANKVQVGIGHEHGQQRKPGITIQLPPLSLKDKLQHTYNNDTHLEKQKD